MDEKTQIEHLSNELENVIDRFRSEYDLSYASVIGVLQIIDFKLKQESYEDEQL